MRALSLKLVGSGMLALAALLVSRQICGDTAATRGQISAANTEAVASVAGATSNRSRSGAARSAATQTMAEEAAFTASALWRDAPESAERDVDTNCRLPGSSNWMVATHPLPAVQLGVAARLPAVIITQFSCGGPGQQSATPEMGASTEALVASFYLDLAKRAAAGSPYGVASAENGAQLLEGEATAVIEPGPVLEAASATANEQFRALFGQNAYNRHSIISALELSSHEPVGRGSGP